MGMKDKEVLKANHASANGSLTIEKALFEYLRTHPEPRYSPEKLEKKRMEVTLMNDRVFEGVFGDNKNNDLLAQILSELRKIHGLPIIPKVLSSHVQNSSIYDVLFGRRMIADLVGDAEKEIAMPRLNFTVEVQAEPEDGFAIRGTISSANVMRLGFEKGMSYLLAPDVIGISILGFKLPELLYTNEFCTRIVRTNYDAPTNFFLADKYSEYYLEMPKLKKKEQFQKKYHELWEICKVFKDNVIEQEEAIRMGVIMSPIAQKLSDEFRRATKDPQMMEEVLTSEEFRDFLINRDFTLRNESRIEGKVEGKIELYYSEMGFTVEQIAEKLSLSKALVIEVLKNEDLI